MIRAAAAGILVAAMAAAAAQNSGPGFSGGERVETGEITVASGAVESYRIRLLPVDSFPALPPVVATQLRERSCMIPQSFEAQQPENVIQGQFRAAGSADWAALCSVGGITTLYVFFGGEYGSPMALRSQKDTAWLGAEPGSGVYGSGWGISTRHAADLQASGMVAPGVSVDHDAIEDARLEHKVTIRYFANGQWIVLSQQSYE